MCLLEPSFDGIDDAGLCFEISRQVTGVSRWQRVQENRVATRKHYAMIFIMGVSSPDSLGEKPPVSRGALGSLLTLGMAPAAGRQPLRTAMKRQSGDW